jgi:hypothetical protein
LKTKPKPTYRTYISSDKWRSRHRPWLKQSGNRCSMFPWIRLGQVGGKYHPYDMHHTTYERLGKEKLWRDVLPLSPFAHDWVIHGILSGWKSAGKQKHYPNAAQRLAHAWCRLPPRYRQWLWPALAALAALLIIALG